MTQSDITDNLFNAIQDHDLQTVQSLTSAGASLRDQRVIKIGARSLKEARGTAVHAACVHFQQSAAIVQHLCNKGASVTQTGEDELQLSPIHLASLCNPSAALVQLLLEWQADPNAEDADYDTPLHYASQNEDTAAGAAIAEVLLQHGADVATKDPNGWSPLHLAVREAHLPLMQVLLRWKANPIAKTADGNWTPLHVAAINNSSAAICQQLIDNEADLTDLDMNENTALHLLAKYNDESAECVINIAKCLLRAGCNPLSKNSEGQTASDICTDKDKSELAVVIREYEEKVRQ